MNITDVRITPVEGNPKLKAFAVIELEHCFVIHDIKIIKAHGTCFVSMPSKKLKDGSFKDIVHPVKKAMREKIEMAVLGAYKNQIRSVA